MEPIIDDISRCRDRPLAVQQAGDEENSVVANSTKTRLAERSSGRAWLLWFVMGAAIPTVTTAANIVPLNAKSAPTDRAQYPAQMVAKDTALYDGSYLGLGQYTSKDGAFKVGLWETGPGTLVADDYPNDEYCLVLEGQLTITNRDGTQASFKPGDTFVIPKGWAGTWRMTARFKKQFVAFKSR